MLQVSVGAAISVILAILAVFSGIIAILVRTLSRSVLENVSNQMMNFEKGFTTAIVDLKERRIACEQSCHDAMKELETEIRQSRDRWSTFLEKYTILDTTRGNKVDALFRSVDDMRSTIKELKPALTRKLEDMHRTCYDQLHLKIKDMVREELDRATK